MLEIKIEDDVQMTLFWIFCSRPNEGRRLGEDRLHDGVHDRVSGHGNHGNFQKTSTVRLVSMMQICSAVIAAHPDPKCETWEMGEGVSTREEAAS